MEEEEEGVGVVEEEEEEEEGKEEEGEAWEAWGGCEGQEGLGGFGGRVEGQVEGAIVSETGAERAERAACWTAGGLCCWGLVGNRLLNRTRTTLYAASVWCS